MRAAKSSRVIVTHGTDTMIESAQYLLGEGAAAGKCVAFTGAMKPERFKDSDAAFNLCAPPPCARRALAARSAPACKRVAMCPAWRCVPLPLTRASCAPNSGGAVCATSMIAPGTVVVSMGGRAIDCTRATRRDGRFVEGAAAVARTAGKRKQRD